VIYELTAVEEWIASRRFKNTSEATAKNSVENRDNESRQQ